MKKQIAALALILVSSTAFAANFGSGIDTAGDIRNVKPIALMNESRTLIISGNVNATSNLIMDGRSMSDKNPSVFANAAVQYTTKFGTVGAEYGIAHVNFGQQNPSESRQDLFVTYNTKFSGVDLIAKVGERRFGGYHAAPDTSAAVIVGAAYKGAFVAVDKTISTEGGADFEMREKVGYTFNASDSLDITASANFAQLGKADTTRFEYAEVRAEYALTKAVTLTAVATKGGRNENKTHVPSQFGASVTYAF